MAKKLMYSDDYIALGLLILRIGIGIAFVVHGIPKVFGGAEHLAGALAKAGIPGGVVGAYLAGMAEFLGGLALIAGILFRPTTIVLAFTMVVALAFHLNLGDAFVKYSHALESLVLFVALTITGPGRYSMDHLFFLSEKEKKRHHRKYHHHHVPTPSGAPG